MPLNGLKEGIGNYYLLKFQKTTRHMVHKIFTAEVNHLYKLSEGNVSLADSSLFQLVICSLRDVPSIIQETLGIN